MVVVVVWVDVVWDGVEEVRSRSPLIMASDWITVRPPRMMFVVPWIWERRETLLPASVEMYSPLGGLGGILSPLLFAWVGFVLLLLVSRTGLLFGMRLGLFWLFHSLTVV